MNEPMPQPEPAYDLRMLILGEVYQERERQIEKGYDGLWDIKKPPSEFFCDIAAYAAWAQQMHRMGSQGKARRRLVQVAALAVAAIEAMEKH